MQIVCSAFSECRQLFVEAGLVAAHTDPQQRGYLSHSVGRRRQILLTAAQRRKIALNCSLQRCAAANISAVARSSSCCVCLPALQTVRRCWTRAVAWNGTAGIQLCAGSRQQILKCDGLGDEYEFYFTQVNRWLTATVVTTWRIFSEDGHHNVSIVISP